MSEYIFIAGSDYNKPSAVLVDAVGNVWLSDSGNHRIAMISKDGTVSTMAGSVLGAKDGVGSIAQFNNPRGMDRDVRGNIVVADTGSNLIRRIEASSADATLQVAKVSVVTLAGSTAGFVDGTATAAQFQSPTDVAVDGIGQIYVADSENHCIRKLVEVQNSWQVSSFAGNCGQAPPQELSETSFSKPVAIVYHKELDVLFVSDEGYCAIYRLTVDGNVSLLCGSGCSTSSSVFLDSSGSSAKFGMPAGMIVSSVGHLIVADSGSSRIRLITTTGSVTTLYATPGSVEPTLNKPTGIAASADRDDPESARMR